LNNENYIEALIARVLSGEATPSELLEVERWKNDSDENQSYFESLQKIFNLSPAINQQEEFDTDAAWAKVKSGIYNSHQSDIQNKIKPLTFPQLMLRIAAVLLLVGGLSYTIYTVVIPEKPAPVTLASGEDVSELVLPDSSRVVLNRNSVLVYTYSGKHRKVELKGEAFFDLAGDPERPFELFAGTLQITDIGTAFNVKTSNNNDSVVVMVSDGEVLLTSTGSKSLSLVKGEQAVYYKQRDEFIKSAVTDTNALAYKTKIFVFENASLGIIVRKLSEVYNTGIQISDNIEACHLTATFRNETIENILEVIAETLKLEVIKLDNGYVLKGEICEE